MCFTLIFLVCYSLWYLEGGDHLGEEELEVEALVAEVGGEDDSDVVVMSEEASAIWSIQYIY